MRKKLTMPILLPILLLAGCRQLDDYNINPNEPVSVPTSYLLNGAMAGVANAYWGDSYCLLFSQYWSQNYNPDISRYQLTPYYFYGWASPGNYSALLNLQEVIRLCTEAPEANREGGDPDNQIAVARIVRAFEFQAMTDCWGDIPYSQAVGESLSPIYDTQESIYRDLLRELDAAALQIRPDAPGPVADLVFSGDMARWKKFAAALTLRIAIRLADRDWPAAKSAIEKAFATGAFGQNDDNARFHFQDDFPNPHSFLFQNASPNSISATLENALKSLDDPRLSRYAAPAVNTGLYTGKRYGLPADENAAEDPLDFSQPNGALLEPDAPAILMDFAEQCFTLAEAIERGATLPGTAGGWYHNGIRASMEYWDVDSTSIQLYLDRPDVAYATAGGSWKEKIGRQKWLALYMQGIQGWSEWRRLDFGILSPPPGLSFLATRFLYPVDEQTVNNQNYLDAVNRLPGGDKLTSKVWWDVH